MEKSLFSVDELLKYLRGELPEETRRNLGAALRANPDYLDMLDAIEETIQLNGFSIFDDYQTVRKTLDDAYLRFMFNDAAPLAADCLHEKAPVQWDSIVGKLEESLLRDFENYVVGSPEGPLVNRQGMKTGKKKVKARMNRRVRAKQFRFAQPLRPAKHSEIAEALSPAQQLAQLRPQSNPHLSETTVFNNDGRVRHYGKRAVLH